MSEDTQTLTIAAWLEDLGDECITDDALYAAYVEYKNSPEKWMPAPGVLRTRAIELVQGNVKDAAETAWQGVIDCEYGRDPQYLVDNLSRIVIQRLGGFDAMGAASSEDVSIWWHKRFVEMYAELKQRDNASVPMLAGGAQKFLQSTADKMRINKPTPALSYEDKRERLLRQAEAMNAR